MRFAAFTTVAASAGEATSSAEHLGNLRQQTIPVEELGFEAWKQLTTMARCTILRWKHPSPPPNATPAAPSETLTT